MTVVGSTMISNGADCSTSTLVGGLLDGAADSNKDVVVGHMHFAKAELSKGVRPQTSDNGQDDGGDRLEARGVDGTEPRDDETHNNGGWQRSPRCGASGR